MVRRSLIKLTMMVLLITVCFYATPQGGPQCYCPSPGEFAEITCRSWCNTHEGVSTAFCTHLAAYYCSCSDGTWWSGIDPN